MHIPDGYLGPPTYLAAYAAIAPIWALAARKVKDTFEARRVPLLAISAAFSFLIMMFNIPIPGGSTGHAVGAVLVAIAVGPWGACIAVSIAVVIQALMFGDGGITSIGANCFNMAFIMPFTGYYLFKALDRVFGGRKGSAFAAAAASYLGLNLAAFATSVEFGIQPLLHTGADGRPLYCPYPLSATIPAMMGEHLFLFGFVEAIVTGLVVFYLQKSRSAWILGPVGAEVTT